MFFWALFPWFVKGRLFIFQEKVDLGFTTLTERQIMSFSRSCGGYSVVSPSRSLECR